MDIARLQKLSGIIAESADITKKIKSNTVTTNDEGEAITNRIEQGENGEIKVHDEVEVKKTPTVPKDVAKKALKLKETFDLMLQAARK